MQFLFQNKCSNFAIVVIVVQTIVDFHDDLLQDAFCCPTDWNKRLKWWKINEYWMNVSIQPLHGQWWWYSGWVLAYRCQGPGFYSFLSPHLYSFNLVLSLDVYLQDSFPVQLAMCLASYTAVLGSNLGAAAEFVNRKKDWTSKSWDEKLIRLSTKKNVLLHLLHLNGLTLN